MSLPSPPPLLFDSLRSREPYIRLPSPHSNILITPPRPTTDASPMTRILNSPLVYPHLSGPPYPYQQSDAESFLLMISRACEDSLNEYLEILDGKSGRKWLSNGLPVRSIREEVADEKGEVEWRFLGDVEVRRALLVEVRDEDERERKKKVNDELEVGDEGVEWEVGCKSIFSWSVLFCSNFFVTPSFFLYFGGITYFNPQFPLQSPQKKPIPSYLLSSSSPKNAPMFTHLSHTLRLTLSRLLISHPSLPRNHVFRPENSSQDSRDPVPQCTYHQRNFFRR